MCHHCWDPPLLLPGILLLDVSRGGPAVPHARGGLWERILAEKVLLRLWLPLPRHCGCRLHSYRLQELWDGESVSGLTRRLSFCTEPHVSEQETPLWILILFLSDLRSWTIFFFFFYIILKEAKRFGGWGGGCSHIKAFLLKDPPVTSCL